MEKLTFKYTGEFITNRVREMLWQEHKSYSEVEQVCLQLLNNLEVPESQTKDIIRQILEGRKQLTGVAGDGDCLTLEDDNAHLKLLDTSTLLSENLEMKKSLRKLKNENKGLKSCIDDLEKSNQTLSNCVEQLTEIADKYSDLLECYTPLYRLREHLSRSAVVDSITFYHQIYKNPSEEDKQKFSQFCEDFSIYPGKGCHGDWSWVCFYDKTTDKCLELQDLKERGIAIVKAKEPKKSVEQSEITDIDTEPRLGDSYGWLSPDGSYTKSEWGEHEKVAHELVCKFHWEDEFYSWCPNGSNVRLCRDFLVLQKNWVLIDNPMIIGAPKVTCNYEKLTKKQREFLFDYFSSINDELHANYYFKE